MGVSGKVSRLSHMIHTEHLTKYYDQFAAVKDVSFSVKKGETLALIGTSGSGKTTVLKMLNGLIPRSSGKITIRDTPLDMTDDVALRRSMGYVIQDVGLFPHYTIARNISVMAELQHTKLEKQAIISLLEKVGVSEELYNSYPDQLSGGQQQRIGIARALAMDPDILLMDEPFGALDPITRQQIQREFLELPGIHEKAIVMVTHDLDEAALLGTRICIMDSGMIQQQGTLRDLLFRPANEFVSEFVANKRSILEWRAISLNDLFAFLPQGDGGNRVELQTTIADIVERNVAGHVIRNGESRSVSRDQVMSCFYNSRSKIVEGLANE